MDKAKLIFDILRADPLVTPYLSADGWRILRAAAGFDGIRNTYWAIIYDAVEGYLTNNKPVTVFKNDMKRGMSDAFVQAAELAYQDAGADLPLDEDTLAWLVGMQSAEFGHIDDLFARLKAEWDGIDPVHEAFARADGYTKTLDAIYAEAKMRGSKNATAEFVGDDGAESCVDCQKMKGKRHRLQYIIDNDLIPRPGNTNYACNGYHCEHYWRNVKTGEEYR